MQPDPLTLDLFAPPRRPRMGRAHLAPGATLLAKFAQPVAEDLLERVQAIAHNAPFRRMLTPSGSTMSVQMTNCGTVGWVSDRRSYRYVPCDPETGAPWPAMPALFANLAHRAAQEAGFQDFQPDVCLINRYSPGNNLNLHQDRDEQDFTQPIVSVSLGLPGVFLLGGLARTDPTIQEVLEHGDVLVFGGPSRLRFHGVKTILPDARQTPVLDARVNLTFRKAL
jgi:DNA oxidative demethylase